MYYKELNSIKKIPKHVAIIMDGNRRWARMNGLSIHDGHKSGTDNLLAIVKAAFSMGIKVLTVYGLSTENWSRDSNEIDVLIKLISSFLRSKIDEMVENGVKLSTIGDLSSFPSKVIKDINDAKAKTANCDKIDLVIALNYGSRDEIKRTFEKIIKIKDLEINEKVISENMDFPTEDPELLIRTGGDKRLSNFLLWQLSYAELYFTDVFWPDFSDKHLLKAILDYNERERRFGK